MRVQLAAKFTISHHQKKSVICLPFPNGWFIIVFTHIIYHQYICIIYIAYATDKKLYMGMVIQSLQLGWYVKPYEWIDDHAPLWYIQ